MQSMTASLCLLLAALQPTSAFTPAPLTHCLARAPPVVVMKSPSDVIGPLYRKRFDKKTRKFVREKVSDDAVNLTVRRLVLFQGAGAALLAFAFGANIAKGGDVGSPPGYEEAAKAKAAKKAAYIASEQARKDGIAARVAADSAYRPPKPWER